MVRVSRANAKVRLWVCRCEAEATPSPGNADWADPAGTNILSVLRACFFCAASLQPVPLPPKIAHALALIGQSFYGQHSTINSGRGNFHGSCPVGKRALESPREFKSPVSSRSALSQSLEGSANPQIDHKSWWSPDLCVRRSVARSRLCRPNSCIR